MGLWKHSFRGRTLLAAITACCAQGFMLLGYDQGVMSGIIGANNRFGRDFGNPDADMQGNIVALYDIGCVVGSLFVLFAGEWAGRRKMIMAGGIIMVIGAIILSSSYTIAQLIVGRIVTGFGNGINSSTIPVYQSEASPAALRGVFLTFNGTITIFGLVIAYWLDYGTSFYESDLQWRFPLAFQALFAICLAVQIVGLPESPRWLVQHGRHDEARDVLAALKDRPHDDEEVETALLDIQTAVEQESLGGPFRWAELFSWGKTQNFRRVLLSIGIELMQQWTGSNLINYYAPNVYTEAVGLSRNLSLIMGGVASCIYLCGSILPLLLVEKYGRRSLLIACSIGLTTCFSLVSILLSLQTKSAGWGAVAMIFVFQFVYGVGWLPVPWFYPSEISTTRIRAKVGAIASAWNWLAVFAVVKITPIAITNINWRTFIIFAVLNATFIPIVYCFYPETAGLELEDIDHIFERGGITGGVFSTRGHPVKKGAHERQTGTEDIVRRRSSEGKKVDDVVQHEEHAKEP